MKKIDKRDVRLGMFIHALGGSWFSHPFWRSRFLLTSEEDLAKLLASDVPDLLIDTDKGLDVAPVAQDGPAGAGAAAGTSLSAAATDPVDEGTPRAQDRSRSGSARAAQRADKPSAMMGSVDLSTELDRATAIIDQAQITMRSLFEEVRLGKAVEAKKLDPLIAEMSGSLSRNRAAMTNIVRLKTKDSYTYMHSVAVSTLMINLGQELGLDAPQIHEAGIAGLLHDVGKMAVPNVILAKEAGLTEPEWKIVRAHPERGHAILLESYDVPATALDVCLHHHEKIDGTGYPERLAGENISLFARMGAVCDVYDAVTSVRPYKKPWTPAEALRRMFSWSGHFDRSILEAFIRSIGVYPVSTLLELSSGQLAVVLEHSGDPTHPRVRVFRAMPNGPDQPPYDVDLSTMPGLQIAKAIDPAQIGIADWEHKWRSLVKSAHVTERSDVGEPAMQSEKSDRRIGAV